MTKITKGTKVYMIRRWSADGAFYVTTCTVGSWGKVQGYLIREENGVNLKEAFHTQRCNGDVGQFNMTLVVPVADCADPAAKALELSTTYVAHDTARIEAQIAGSDDAGYIEAMRKSLAKLAPRVANVVNGREVQS